MGRLRNGKEISIAYQHAFNQTLHISGPIPGAFRLRASAAARPTLTCIRTRWALLLDGASRMGTHRRQSE